MNIKEIIKAEIHEAQETRNKTVKNEHEHWVNTYSEPEWQDYDLQNKHQAIELTKLVAAGAFFGGTMVGAIELLSAGIQEGNYLKAIIGACAFGTSIKMAEIADREQRHITTMNDTIFFHSSKK